MPLNYKLVILSYLYLMAKNNKARALTGKCRKISDEEFLSYLRNNGGLYARTAKAIQDAMRIELNDPDFTYTRQAVYSRVKEHEAELTDIKEELNDKAEGGLLDLMSDMDKNIVLKACSIWLKAKAGDRGWVDKKEITKKKITISYTKPNAGD